MEIENSPVTYRVTYRKSALRLFLVAAIFSLTIPQAMAHHSFAMFDRGKTIRAEGVVSKFIWTNPHVFIEVDVPDKKGGMVHYKIESASVNMLMRQNWKASSIKSGDRITIAFNPLKNGLRGGLLTEVTLPNGKVLKGP